MQRLPPKRREGLNLSDKTARSLLVQGFNKCRYGKGNYGGKVRHFLRQSEMKSFSRSISTFFKAVLLTSFFLQELEASGL